MNVEEAFNNALAEWIQEEDHLDKVEIQYVKQTASIDHAGCDTCGYGEEQSIEVEVYYRWGRSRTRGVKYYSGDVVELINLLGGKEPEPYCEGCDGPCRDESDN